MTYFFKTNLFVAASFFVNLFISVNSFAQSPYIILKREDGKIDSIMYDSIVHTDIRTTVYYYHRKKIQSNQNDSITEFQKYNEQKPIFPGGEIEMFKFIAKNLVYPSIARENGVQGTVYVGVVINLDGSLTDVTVKGGVGAGCSEEAVRVIQSMPKWIPGTQNGKIVRVAYTIPIKFKLDK